MSSNEPSTAAVVPTLSRDTLAVLRARLRDLSFTSAGLRALWGTAVDEALSRSNAAPALRFTMRELEGIRTQGRRGSGVSRNSSGSSHQQGRALAACAALFVLGEAVEPTAAAFAFGRELVDRLQAEGLLTAGPDGALRSALALTPFAVPQPLAARTPEHATLWLFCDHGTLNRADPVDGDFVLGVGGAGRTLAAITPRHRVASALDLGTGCGIQALILALHAEQVVATDVSTRALALTALNARLAGFDNVETRLGSLFEPAPETFDLIVSNPPFVITPQGQTSTLTYRDGGQPGDTIMRELLRDLPAHLCDDGQAALLGNWEHTSVLERTDPTDWVSDAGTHITVIERDQLDPVRYAETWIRDGGVPRASGRWNADTKVWIDDFERRGVCEIGFGWVRMHRTTSTAAVRDFATITGPLAANPDGISVHLDTRLELLEWLAEADDAQLLETHFVRAPGLVEHRHFTPGEDQPSSLTLEQGIGFGQTFTIDSALAGFIGVADGSLSLGAVAGALAQLLGLDEAALAGQLIAQVRDLVPAGIVFPQEP